jgi:hypothetical protein
MIFLDTESKGLVGPTSTIQWKLNDEPTKTHLVWDEPARETLRLIEKIVEEAVCGFHLSHDWFHLQRAYCILRLLDPTRPPTVQGWLRVQKEAVWGPCVKPKSALDLMLYAMRGPAQSLMERDDIRIKKVPRQIAHWLAERLKDLVDLPGIYFYYRKNGYEWVVDDHDGNQMEFPDVVLKWGASRGLKPLGRHLLNADVLDYELPSQFMPKEDLWNPFGDGWVAHSDYHDAYWRLDPRAQRYAREDVEVLTYGLWKHFGSPPPGDADSLLAILVGCSRWRGFALDLERLKQIRDDSKKKMEAAPRAPKTVLQGLRDRCSPIEAMTIRSTDSETLAKIGGTREENDWKPGLFDENHPACQFARAVIKARSAEKELNVCEKLLRTERFHPDFKVIGALSGRMAGSGKLNAQGISGKQKGSCLREAFILADGDELLDAGDFDSFEVAIAAAVYNDPGLTADLSTGKKIHAIYGSIMLELEYDVVKKNKGTYTDSKRAFLGRLYGAQDPKVSKVLNISLEQVRRNEAKLAGRYPGIGRARQETADKFCSMRQVGEVGSRIEWRDPAEYEESLLGYRRYFTLENKIVRALFDLASHAPEELRTGGSCQRTKGRAQTLGGAAQSAIYACAFGIQASAMRQAANHRIQSTGARITKELQADIWDHQPCGIHQWIVRPMQIHDEVQCPRSRSVDLRGTVKALLARHRTRIPLLEMAWMQGLKSWAEKG